ncbi:hypothetical protein ACFCYB_20690 [Streptomyces sp. NPDC056309]|uniref:hypothetical protein n=1 Tax=unclassified Streptomyces TaxID=2593676 RepID=UPI0035DB36F4
MTAAFAVPAALSALSAFAVPAVFAALSVFATLSALATLSVAPVAVVMATGGEEKIEDRHGVPPEYARGICDMFGR